ncbi:4'-phosphopantetheinyl transferase family protein [Limimaricola hongkongensis]|uniref:Enterobactin synthase component D n=1 Tax=Limimaricola hongkongensis DSM 17492 TaxID=1122180 RepID=A0A017HCJ4_9RHOB|nr:4'-phosphopantetheinyl transferase superfamily protein [Limimaricola hongkongensis]EYD72071.1 phosphopantetheinyl transferase PptA, putative [Limimaricola hongkongensis DSM 17492]
MSDLVAVIERLGGAGVAAAMVPVGAGGACWPEEAAAMTRARPARRAGFAAGRAAARAAMRRLGHAPMAVPMGADRAPVWPEGLCGSISHDDALAVAALCRGGPEIGIDIEPALPIEPGLWPEIADAEELAATGLAPGLAARLVFCVKEAAFKAQFPASRRMLGFDAMRIARDGDRVVARLRHRAGPHAPGTAFHGGWARCAGRFVVVMRAPVGPGPVSGGATLS